MISDSAVFVTDGVNLQKMMLPLATIVESMETPLAKAIENGIPYGMPANMGHDLCKPIGWSVPRGVYIAKDRSRQLGTYYLPETDEDQQQIRKARNAFLQYEQHAQIEPYADELEVRIKEHASKNAKLWYIEGAAAVEPNLAASLYPEFFAASSGFVDKDGLVDFSVLLSRTKQVLPGIFHEPERDLLLFAHRYFRRSLSLRNSLNAYALRSFSHAASLSDVKARLKLDPDMVGHPASAHSVIELEYWHGPTYSDDIASIPSGVATHKSSEGERRYSGIDKTQIWWKEPETRANDTGTRAIRTFEVEELVEDESPGLAAGNFGCRYAHAEYDLGSRTISHFDGAIRAYESEAYLERIDRRIDRAGKHAQYTKLFRLDGALPVAMWKRVLTDWYRGNRLIPEYLGAKEDLAEHRPAPRPSGPAPEIPALSAFLCLERALGAPAELTVLEPDQSIMVNGEHLPVAEIGNGNVAELMKLWRTPEITTVSAETDSATLARILLPGTAPTQLHWLEVATPLAAALSREAESGGLAHVALAIGWIANATRTTLSIAGEAARVARLLEASLPLIDPAESASSWIEAFRDALLDQAPDLEAPVDWPPHATKIGRLRLERAARVDMRFDFGTGDAAILEALSAEASPPAR